MNFELTELITITNKNLKTKNLCSQKLQIKIRKTEKC